MGQALADLAQVKAEGVELGRDRLQAGQLLVGVALAGDELAADFGSGEAAEQAGGPERGVGLDVVRDEVAEVVEEARQVELGGLAPAARGGVLAGEAGAALVHRLAKGVPPPAEKEIGLALPQVQGSYFYCVRGSRCLNRCGGKRL